MSSFLVHGENFNQQESMIIWQFASVTGCVQFFMLVHFDCVYTLAKSESPAQTPSESCLDLLQDELIPRIFKQSSVGKFSHLMLTIETGRESGWVFRY